MCEHYFSPPHKSMRESTRDSPGPQRDIELRRGQLEWHRISFKGQQTGRPPNPNVKPGGGRNWISPCDSRRIFRETSERNDATHQCHHTVTHLVPLRLVAVSGASTASPCGGEGDRRGCDSALLCLRS